MANIQKKVQSILNRRLEGGRISTKDAFFLYQNAPLSLLIKIAHSIKFKLFGKKVFFIQNVHVEPTNYCIYKCKFCSFHKDPNEPMFWEDDINTIINKINNLPHSLKEIHITGGVHPQRDLQWYLNLLHEIKNIRPSLQIKAFTAIEIQFMAKKSGKSIAETLQLLKNAGLDALAGGGAEIFNHNVRKQLCPEKGEAQIWLNIHKQAHQLKIVSNATMLYGHIETIQDRIEHMNNIRLLQDETQGFNCFIPLKFRHQQNFLSHIQELPLVDDLKVFALSRIFFDNILHIKAYWPMIGREKAALLIHAGADDIDGTIYDSTKIYTMAGSEEQKPMISVEELKALIKSENFIPVERDLFYNELS